MRTEAYIILMNLTRSRIPSGRRQTSFIFYKPNREEMNSGISRTNLVSGYFIYWNGTPGPQNAIPALPPPEFLALNPWRAWKRSFLVT